MEAHRASADEKPGLVPLLGRFPGVSVAELQVGRPRPQGAVLPGIEQHVAWRQRVEHVRGHLLDDPRPLCGHARMFPRLMQRHPRPAPRGRHDSDSSHILTMK